MEGSLNYYMSYFWGIFIPFGGLIFWPIIRLLKGANDKRSKRLRWQFLIHIILVGASFAVVYYYWLVGNRDWLHALILPHGLGMASLIIAVVILLAGHNE